VPENKMSFMAKPKRPNFEKKLDILWKDIEEVGGTEGPSKGCPGGRNLIVVRHFRKQIWGACAKNR